MNIFEGARRIAKLLAAAIFIGAVVSAIMQRPTMTLYYAVTEEGVLQSISHCGYPTERSYATVDGRPDLQVTICGVSNFMPVVALGKEEILRVDSLISERRTSDLTERFWYLVVSLTVGWALCWAIGWIVRGFMGITRGMDRKV